MAAIMVATVPLLSMVIGQAWGVERMTVRGVVGLLLGFGGIVLLVGFPAVPVTDEFVVGCISSLLGSLSAAFGSLFAGHRLKSVGPLEVTSGSFLFGGLLTLPLLLLVPVPAPPQPVDYVHLLTLGCIMSGKRCPDHR